MVSFPFKFGRAPHEWAKLDAAPAHRFAAVLPPPSLVRPDYTPGMFGNDVYGCCTCSNLANTAAGIASLNGYGLVVDPDKVIAFFAAQHGIDPTDTAALAAAEGLQMADVLNYMQTHGFDIGPRMLVGQWGTLGLDRVSLANGMAHLGGCYLGIDLYEADIEAFQGGFPWDTSKPKGDLVSGHAVSGFSYSGLQDGDTVKISTWGTLQSSSWAWVQDRLREAHGVVFKTLARADGTWFDGFEAGTLGDPMTA